ncbi:hypothetical protein NM688_g7808 [Phlebia brevispora]|uniref:Uncharacterized protein n=1 Tax=Phlebia brevispora TaxID=194682 RepID=A0ACC1S0W3_9APHY|nr:hypothetical protein NM688_g7808 [Phlebia brevispora]
MTMSGLTIPKTMKALVTQADHMAAVQDISVPTIEEDEILVRTVAVAQNPTDWKFIRTITNAGTICGCDWSGYVVQTGKNVTTFAVGDHVAGFVHGGTYTDHGAFAEYVKTSSDLAWKVPRGTISHEEAASMNAALWTAVQGLFNPQGVGLVEPPSKVSKPEWIFINGGSGSVGMYAIQLAKLAGYKVVTTSSPRNFDLVKSLGADAVVDYRDPETVNKLKETTADSIHRAFDAVGEASSQQLSVQAFAAGPGKLVTTQAPKQEVQALRKDVVVQGTMIYTVFGREIFMWGRRWPVSQEDREHMAQFLKKVPELVRAGKIRPNPVKLWEGGLESINDGLQYMFDGRNSAEKIVYRIDSRRQPGIAIGRLCEKCDGKCPVCDSYVRPETLVRICDECNFGTYGGRCIICGSPGISDAYYCAECTRLEKDRDGCPKIVNLGASRTDLFYERRRLGFKKG